MDENDVVASEFQGRRQGTGDPRTSPLVTSRRDHFLPCGKSHDATTVGANSATLQRKYPDFQCSFAVFPLRSFSALPARPAIELCPATNKRQNRREAMEDATGVVTVRRIAQAAVACHNGLTLRQQD
jgi:hypothetical protein